MQYPNFLQKQCFGETDATHAMKRRSSFSLLKQLTTKLGKKPDITLIKLHLYIKMGTKDV